MAYWMSPSTHDVSRLRARSSGHEGFAYIEITAYGEPGEDAARVEFFLPASRAEYAHRIAEAINAIDGPPAVEEAQPPSADADADLPF